MKRDFSLNVSRPTYGATAPSSVVAPAHTTGLVAQPVGREHQAGVHSLVLKDRLQEVEDKSGLLC